MPVFDLTIPEIMRFFFPAYTFMYKKEIRIRSLAPCSVNPATSIWIGHYPDAEAPEAP